MGVQMTEYIIRAGLHDETNEGWVWTSDQPSRTVVRITGPDSRRKIYCVARQIDKNFLNIYNQSNRIFIDEKNKLPTVVMGQWYRDALGGFDTTNEEKDRGPVKLTIESYGGGIRRLWAPLVASSQHPDISVRLGTRLGVLGTWLGIIGILQNVWPFLGGACLIKLLVVIIVLLSAGFSVWACLPLSPPPLKQHD